MQVLCHDEYTFWGRRWGAETSGCCLLRGAVMRCEFLFVMKVRVLKFVMSVEKVGRCMAMPPMAVRIAEYLREAIARLAKTAAEYAPEPKPSSRSSELLRHTGASTYTHAHHSLHPPGTLSALPSPPLSSFVGLPTTLTQCQRQLRSLSIHCYLYAVIKGLWLRQRSGVSQLDSSLVFLRQCPFNVGPFLCCCPSQLFW